MRVRVRSSDQQAVAHPLVQANLQSVIIRNSTSLVGSGIGIVSDVGSSQRRISGGETGDKCLNSSQGRILDGETRSLPTVRILLRERTSGKKNVIRSGNLCLIERQWNDFMHPVVANVAKSRNPRI